MKLLSQVFSSLRKVGTLAEEKSAAVSFALVRRSLCIKTSLAALALIAALGAEARIPLGDPIVSEDENLLVNGDFKSKYLGVNSSAGSATAKQYWPLRWQVVSRNFGLKLGVNVNRDVRFESDTAYSGGGDTAGGPLQQPNPVDGSLRIMDNSNTAEVVIRSEKRLAIPGESYVATARVFQDAGSPTPAAKLYLQFWGANDELLVEEEGSALEAAPDARTKWKLTKAKKLAPPAALHVTVSLRTTAAATNDEPHWDYWDNVTLKLKPDFPEDSVNYDPALVLGRHELFIDDYRLEAGFDVARKVQAPTVERDVVTKTKSWESDVLTMSGTVLKDAGSSGYQMWYYSNGRTLYATSSDGVSWSKPTLNQYPYGTGGSTANNIAFPNDSGRITVVYDASDPQYKFKALSHAGPTDGYYAWYSPDGKSGWDDYQTAAVLPYGNLSNLAFEPAAGSAPKRFIATTRQRTVHARSGSTFEGDRMAFTSTSADLITWTAPNYTGSMPTPAPQFSPAAEGDQADDMAAQSRRNLEAQIDAMPIYPYQGIYIGFPQVFELTGFPEDRESSGDGFTQVQIASSRDLRVWHRPTRAPIIPIGRQGSWDAGGVTGVASTMIEDAGKLHVYYSASNVTRSPAPGGRAAKSTIARATWDRDRLVAIHHAGTPIKSGDPVAKRYEGFVQTKVVTVPAGATSLKINARVGTGGQIRVTTIDNTGTEGTLSQVVGVADHTAVTVTWSGGYTPSGSIKLRFYLRNADLFSFWFE